MGIFLALVALFCWGFGDFLIQRSARVFGDWIALFFIVAVGAVVLAPFGIYDLATSGTSQVGYAILTAASLLMLFAALVQFEALKRGKISVIEPILAFEVLATVLIGSFVLREHLTPAQTVLVVMVIVGIILTATTSLTHFKKIHLEKGVLLAILGAASMGVTDALYGVGARETSPFLIAWFTTVFMTLATFFYLWRTQCVHEIVHDWKKHWRLVTAVGLLDNVAWVAYPASMLFLPVAIATSVSESYIVITVLLGVRINKERIRPHQFVGMVLTIFGVIVLASIAG